jgi:hypothetical protein
MIGGAVLRVADLFHPVDDFAVQRFLNGDMRHSVRRRCAVPVLLTGREPDDIAGPDFLSGAAFALHPAAAGGHDQRLTQRMRMPGGPGARLERHARAHNARRVGRLKQRVHADRAGKILRRSFAGRM